MSFEGMNNFHCTKHWLSSFMAGTLSGSLLAALLWERYPHHGHCCFWDQPLVSIIFFGLNSDSQVKVLRSEGKLWHQALDSQSRLPVLAAACWGYLLSLPEQPGAWLNFLLASRGHDSGFRGGPLRSPCCRRPGKHPGAPGQRLLPQSWPPASFERRQARVGEYMGSQTPEGQEV